MRLRPREVSTHSIISLSSLKRYFNSEIVGQSFVDFTSSFNRIFILLVYTPERTRTEGRKINGLEPPGCDSFVQYLKAIYLDKGNIPARRRSNQFSHKSFRRSKWRAYSSVK
ncbi:hypothetical protein AVEN_185387-1 [Araneus ventricosus]|uniref:Uncharacterized protein n=1 Tax=Araneus ventricosus TaxID=182803 RepID=A0A4Y2CHI5_ARAVE|nr:hypothetical protein AVEN_185387-1 [Araneus ventricosus]